MKNLISLILSITLNILVVNAQTSVTIYTKDGKAIEGIIIPELSQENISSSNKYFSNSYPSATLLGNTSATYNCHSYAWNISDGGTTICWINQNKFNGDGNISNYWTNDYYRETTEDKAVKVFYYNSDHSAIVSPTVSGKYESKWGQGPLMRHAPGYGPYSNMNQRKYYAQGNSSGTGSGSSIKTEYGLLSCNAGQGEIGVNVSTIYGIPSSAPNGTAVWKIDNAKGEDALEAGTAIIKSSDNRSADIYFTKVGIYEIYCSIYNNYGDKLGEYWFEPLVTRQ